jgi:uncharacterized protein (DUF1800 family)
MVSGRFPLVEKMTLFWHGHFATALSKVDDQHFMNVQNQTFRRMGTGKFRDLLIAVSKDPAMIIWLDSLSNAKDHPNENYARELMELFTLGLVDDAGLPNYTEVDVREAARAFTGFAIANGVFFFDVQQHDDGLKRVLGLDGNLDGDDVSAHLSSLPQCARFLARRLWTFFAYPDPEPAVVDAMAQAYLAEDTEIRPVLRVMFLRDEFYSRRARTERVCPPVEFLAGTLRAMQARTNAVELPDFAAGMGQELFNPPNVAGWPGGLAWLTTPRQLRRMEFAWRAATARYGEKAISTSTRILLAGLPRQATTPQVVDHLLASLGPVDLDPPARDALIAYADADAAGEPSPLDLRDRDQVDMRIRGLVGIILTLPEAHLV